MIVKCCLSKYKALLILILYITLSTLLNLVQVFNVTFKELGSNHNTNEQIDVVYTWVNGSDPKFLQDLRKFLQLNSTSQDFSNQRFDDKYELKFSLRSLEKYAPWVHHIYIVTNGQIPYWLNLDYEKVTLVTHNEIFVDSFDLPTFSSPAIESHLHRIPGLSNRFIYFNDDIFLGMPVYLDDFMSLAQGFFIYLAWPLPMCGIDCPWVYVGDGQCDTACYNTNCQLDGGDCNIMNKNPWDESIFPPINDDIVYNTSLNQRNSSQSYLFKFNQRKIHYEHPKVLNNSKIGLENEPTAVNRRIFINSTNLDFLIKRHNRSIMLHNKQRQRKRRNKNKPGLYFSNSTLINKLRGSQTNIDAYGASLQHTNRIYNLKYGFKARYAPAHSPILIDKQIMFDLQSEFAREFQQTSRNHIRSEDDMQFAFSYYYYLINERKQLTLQQIFDIFDTDQSGTWSDREIRTILTKLYDLPLTYGTVDHFEETLLNCSKGKKLEEIPTPEYERYVDSKLPTVSEALIENCPMLSEILRQQFGKRNKFKYEIINNAQGSHVIFKMLNSNISEVVGHLDEIRRHRKKFVCLNDNLDEAKVNENELIRAVLYDFYLSLFPVPSKFELPADFRNRFLYIDELNQWKSYHFKLKVCTYFSVLVLCYVLYCNLFKRRTLYRFVNKLFH